MAEAEDDGRRLGVGLEAEPALEGAQIVHRLVDDGEADDGVDQVAVDADVEVDAKQHRNRVAEREEAHIEPDVLEPVEEEDDAKQEQDVVIAGHHVLGAQVDERQDVDPSDLLDIALVAFGHGMRQCGSGERHEEEER